MSLVDSRRATAPSLVSTMSFVDVSRGVDFRSRYCMGWPASCAARSSLANARAPSRVWGSRGGRPVDRNSRPAISTTEKQHKNMAGPKNGTWILQPACCHCRDHLPFGTLTLPCDSEALPAPAAMQMQLRGGQFGRGRRCAVLRLLDAPISGRDCRHFAGRAVRAGRGIEAGRLIQYSSHQGHPQFSFLDPCHRPAVGPMG